MPLAITLRDNTHFVRDKVVALNISRGSPFIGAAIIPEGIIDAAIIAQHYRF